MVTASPTNWTAVVVTFIIVLPLALTAVFFPKALLRLIFNSPSIGSFNLMRTEDYPPSLREAAELANNDPEEFEREFWYAVVFARFLGVFALGFLLLMLVFVLTPAPASAPPYKP